MKKFLLLIVLFVSVFQVLAYTQSDIDNASFLATEGIIVKQSSASWYRLDDSITRAEVMGIALKMKWIVLPNYQCKWYYTDVRSNGWICRAVELAADEWIITRANAKARPQDSITRAEAFSILFKVSSLTPTKEYGTFVSMDTDATQWQKDLFVKVRNSEIEIPGTQYISLNSPAVTYKFFPNRIATRAEIFSFSWRILGNSIRSGQEIRIENNNVILYESWVKIKNLTSDWNSTIASTCINPSEYNNYALVGRAGDFYIISHAFGLCETDAGGTVMLIFDGTSLVNLQNKIKQKFDIQVWGSSSSRIVINNNQIQILGEFSYSADCVDMGCPIYIPQSKITSLGIHVIKEPVGSTPGEFEFFFNPSILF